MFDEMYDKNLEFFKEISLYIIAGKKALEKARNEDLEALKQKAIEECKRANELCEEEW